MPKKKSPQPNPTQQEPTADVKDASLETVVQAFDDSWKYTSGSWHDRWQDNYKLYNNQRVKRGYDGITDTFVPMTFGTVETLTSALFGTKPKFGFLPPASKANQDVDILNSLLDYYWDKDQWSMKVINTGRSMVSIGCGIDYFCWDQDHPRMINVALRDFFIDPNAFELDERSTRYCGRRYLTTLEELEGYEIVDLSKVDENGDPTGEMKKKYKNLDKLKQPTETEQPTRPGGPVQQQTTDKQEKDMFYGSTMDEPTKDQVEVIEYWTVDKVISVANRKVVIEDTENYFKAKARANEVEFPQGILPFAACRNYVDGSLFYAKSDVDFIADQQELLNDITNQNTDAITYNLNQMYTLDPKYAHMLKEIENLPGAVYPVEAGTLVPINHGVIPPEAFNERQNIKADIRETTASNEIIKGASDSGKGNQTATEVNAQIAGAGQRINLKVTQIENEYFHRVAKIVFGMVKLYVTEPMMVQIIGKDGARWLEFDPVEFKGEYEPRIQLDISIQNKKQQQATEAANLLKAFINDPNVNQQELTKLVLSRGFELDPDEVDLLMSPNPMQPMPGMPGDPAAEGMPGAVSPETGLQSPPQAQPPIDPAVLAQLAGAMG